MSETILSQSHLSPFALHVQPVFWDQDKSLSLFPSPHSLILSDRCQPFQTQVAGCSCFNPHSFPVNFSFEILSPLAGNKVELHKLPDLKENE